MSAYTETKAVADAGLAAGQSLWAALATVGLRDADLANQFGIIIDQIADERIGTDTENTLWHAYAMKAIPQERLSGPDRVISTRRADTAYRAYYDACMDDAQDQAIDFRADACRDAAA